MDAVTLAAARSAAAKQLIAHGRGAPAVSTPLRQPVTFLCADDIAQANGTSVGRWADRSPAAADGFQNTTANQPTVVANAINGRAAVRFASGQYLTSASTAEPRTVIAVGFTYGPSAGQRCIASGKGPAGVSADAWYFKAGNGGNHVEFSRRTSVDTSGATDLTTEWSGNGNTDSPATQSAPSILVGWQDGSRIEVLTGVDGIVKGVDFPTGTISTPISGTVIGSSYYSHTVSTDYLRGDLGALLIFDVALTPAELNAWGTFLAAYYGLTWNSNTGLSNPTTDVLFGFRNAALSTATALDDGRAWRSTSGTTPVYSPPAAGVLRDPSVIKLGSTYYMIYTTGAGASVTTSFGLATSTDLTTWTFVGAVDCTAGLASLNRTWAPTWVKNVDGTPYLDGSGKPHLVVTLSADAGATLRPYEMSPTLTGGAFTNTSFSTPAQISTSGIGSAYDFFVFPYGGTWYMICAGGGINVLTSTSPFSGYTLQRSGDWAGFGLGAGVVEAPKVRRLPSGRWRLYCDLTVTGGYMHTADSSSTDLLGNWGPLLSLAVTGGIPEVQHIDLVVTS